MRKGLLLCVLTHTALWGIALADVDISTRLMHYTYQIEGPSDKPNETKSGTMFLMGVPDTDRPGKGKMVLVSAAHVLEEISGETANVHLRQKTADGAFQVVGFALEIRKGAEPLWVRHPTADVAAMKVILPDFVSKQSDEIPALSIDLLADDDMMKKFEIHPGDELLCLGYPLASNAFGFPILRSGKIASYPLTPAKDIKVFLFDFEIFPGNSGGPAYFSDSGRTYGGSAHLGESIQFVAGVVTRQHEKLRLGVVVPAQFVKETLALLDKK